MTTDGLCALPDGRQSSLLRKAFHGIAPVSGSLLRKKLSFWLVYAPALPSNSGLCVGGRWKGGQPIGRCRSRASPDGLHEPAGKSMRKLSGVVADPTGATVAHAQLTLSCGDFRATATSDATGSYSFERSGRQLPDAGGGGELRLSASQDVTVTDAAPGTVLNPELRLGQLNSAVTL